MALKEQMELFEDGGLKDEGNTIDPVSGNDVPPGSTQEEVRDDIPAQLSEGEFVFPADVVRYIGLEKLMQMRQQAKMGLQTMEDMGQMGNSEEAVMPDNLPFELTDLDMDDEEEYNNNTVEMATGGLTGPATGIAGFVPSQVQPIPSVQQPQAPVTPTVQQPTQTATPIAPTYTPAQQQAVPTFTPEQMQDVSYPGVVQTPESAPQTVEIVNPTTGERRTITYIPGVTQLPEGFILASEYTEPETTAVTPTVGQAQVRKDDGDGPPDFSGYENMQARIKEAQRLGFMDVINPFEQLFKSTAIGSMFGGNFKQGQVVNGYIADGMGNLYDPITGRYVQKESIIGQIGEFFNPSELPKKSQEFQNDLLSLIIDKDPTIISATNASNEIKKVSDSISKALQSGSNEDREKAQEDSDNFSKTYLSGKTVNEIKLAEELRKEEKESNFEDIIAKAKEAARKQTAIESNKQLVRDEEKRKQDKRDKEKEKKVTSNFSKDKAKSIKEAIKSSTSSGGRLATGGRAKGGLMEKEVKQPKQMRSGGLASKN